MPVELSQARAPQSRPVHLVGAGAVESVAGLDAAHALWAANGGFKGEAGKALVLPGAEGAVAGALWGTGNGEEGTLALGALARALPDGDWHFAEPPADPDLAALALLLGGYNFTRYNGKGGRALRFVAPEGADGARVARLARGVFLARDLVNTPGNDMGPAELEEAAGELAAAHGAEFTATRGDDLLAAGFPMVHAVGRASARAPRLLDLRWGREHAPRVTVVGKGVCFDTGGLDIKPSSGMLLMKKDMGGAANALGLASMVMEARLPVRLRVLIPAVENAIGPDSFRPGDVLRSRKGLTVEIGNTDAEGRLVLADALALADEEEPDLLLDLATLTGAARVALGPDVVPFYTKSDALAAELEGAARAAEDPLWRMPLWQPYMARLASKVADINNVTSDGFAGSVTAALFLSRFVERARQWAHFDIFAWNPVDKPWCPVGGEAQAIRAVERVLAKRYPAP